MPANAVYVGRPTKWGNPFRPYSTVVLPRSEVGIVGPGGAVEIYAWSVEECLAWYRIYIGEYRRLCERMKQPFLEPLRGKDLACWCPLDWQCHADILLELANRPEGCQ
jgi:hypothetical protein